MGDLDDSFTALLGHQPTDKEKQALYRARDALKLKPTDAIWQLLMVLQYYERLYEQMPARIETAAREVTKSVRAAAEAEATAAQEATRKALVGAVRDAAVRAASAATRAQVAKWVSAAGSIIGISLLAVGVSAFSRGRELGRAAGENVAKRECAALAAASSWANTAEGQLAYRLAQAGSLRELATCSGRGWVAKEGTCFAQPEHGRLHGWHLPTHPDGE